jgi:heme-degrading monooxygenase HmoA
MPMYGTIAKMTLKPGAEEKIMQVMEGPQTGREGHVATYVFKSDADPNIHFVTTIFESQAAYKKFADSPEQDKRFRQMKELLAAEPEWHDGEVVHHDTKVGATR